MKKIKKLRRGGAIEKPQSMLESQPDNTGMTGMMKSRLAIDSHFGNPTARRMTNMDGRSFTFPDGNKGNVLIGSYDNLATPHIQDINGKLKLVENPWSKDNRKRSYAQSLKFNRPQDAEYFGENYKDVAPMMKLYGNGGNLNNTNMKNINRVPNMNTGGRLLDAGLSGAQYGMQGAQIGAMFGGVGAPIGAAAGFLYGGISSMYRSGEELAAANKEKRRNKFLDERNTYNRDLSINNSQQLSNSNSMFNYMPQGGLLNRLNLGNADYGIGGHSVPIGQGEGSVVLNNQGGKSGLHETGHNIPVSDGSGNVQAMVEPGEHIVNTDEGPHVLSKRSIGGINFAELHEKLQRRKGEIEQQLHDVKTDHLKRNQLSREHKTISTQIEMLPKQQEELKRILGVEDEMAMGDPQGMSMEQGMPMEQMGGEQAPMMSWGGEFGSTRSANYPPVPYANNYFGLRAWRGQPSLHDMSQPFATFGDNPDNKFDTSAPFSKISTQGLPVHYPKSQVGISSPNFTNMSFEFSGTPNSPDRSHMYGNDVVMPTRKQHTGPSNTPSHLMRGVRDDLGVDYTIPSGGRKSGFNVYTPPQYNINTPQSQPQPQPTAQPIVSNQSGINTPSARPNTAGTTATTREGVPLKINSLRSPTRARSKGMTNILENRNIGDFDSGFTEGVQFSELLDATTKSTDLPLKHSNRRQNIGKPVDREIATLTEKQHRTANTADFKNRLKTGFNNVDWNQALPIASSVLGHIQTNRELSKHRDRINNVDFKPTRFDPIDTKVDVGHQTSELKSMGRDIQENWSGSSAIGKNAAVGQTRANVARELNRIYGEASATERGLKNQNIMGATQASNINADRRTDYDRWKTNELAGITGARVGGINSLTQSIGNIAREQNMMDLDAAQLKILMEAYKESNVANEIDFPEYIRRYQNRGRNRTKQATQTT